MAEQPMEIAISALKRMLSEVGPDHEFPGDAIWKYATQEVEPLKKPPVFKNLSREGYIENTGEMTHAETPDRRSAPTTKYRFGPLLRPETKHKDMAVSEIPDAFTFACSAVLRVQTKMAVRLCSSLLSKRFLIASGLAGSGKTKIAQAFARWLTPNTISSDPFVPGTTIQSDRVTYYVKGSDSLAVEFWNSEGEDAVRVTIPTAMIKEWADYIEANGVSKDTPARDIRESVTQISKYSNQLHSFETHLKAAAFSLIDARREMRAAKYYEVIPVGADWTGNENVLGYPSGLDSKSYLTKPALDLVLQAEKHPDVPHFLILDEMNLSHVERYFADILSAIESGEAVPLHGDEERKAGGGKPVPQKLCLPPNLFIIGTVNVDETTYMFSPKVLDRANVIEFRMDGDELKDFLGNPAKPDLAQLDGKGASFGKAFAEAACEPASVPEEAKEPFEREMELFFKALQVHGAEFGYRVAYEAARFVHFYSALENHSGEEAWFPAAFDCIIVQKFLPKLHGSRAKLGPLLKKLWFLCLKEAGALGADALKAAEEAARSTDRKAEPSTDPDILVGARYPLSAEKIGRMWRLLNENGFASFAEA